MIIRPAVDSDLDELVQLNDQVQRLHATHYPEEFKYPTVAIEVRAFFESLIAGNENTVLVSVDNNSVQAYLYYETQQKPESAFKFGLSRLYIHHVAVDESLRRSGIATELFKIVEQQARSMGIKEIGLDSWALNKEAHMYFERSGLAVNRLVFSKELD